VAILHREVVERKRWLGEEEFLAAMRLCMLLPGPEAQQLATYVGWRRGGVAGGLLSGTLFVLPGAVLVTALAWLHAAGASLPLVAAAFAGTRPAVVALVALAAWRIGRRSLRSAAAVIVAAAAFAALAAGVNFPLVVLIAGIGGFLAPFDLAPPAKASGDAATGARPEAESVRPETAPFRHVARTAAAWTCAWVVAYLAVRSLHLAGGRGAEIAALFTETTLLSLGGAYAVVPWALDESVARGWLAADERFDALAMGEATPGPLILVVTFIGFLAGWKTGSPSGALAGGDMAAGLAGAAIATFFAFLPSLAMIFTLAPLVRSIRASSRLGRGMAAVGAAVVAAIVLLGLRLAAQAFFPSGFQTLRIDPLAVAVAVACGVALVRGWATTPVVVAAAAAVGAALAAA
jgi:chromate transporter